MTNYQKIYEVAANNYGLITSAQAKEIGVSDKEMTSIKNRGRIEHLSHGVYKIVDYIPVENDIYATAVTSVGPEAYLYGESVLAMHRLCPVGTKNVYVGTPKRVRKKLPKWIKIKNNHNDYQPSNYEGIASQSIKDAILSCKKTIMPSRLIDAAEEANRLGLLYGNDYKEVKSTLKEQYATE